MVQILFITLPPLSECQQLLEVDTLVGRHIGVWRRNDGAWCGKVPVSALQQRREDLLLWRRPECDFHACLLLCLASYFSFFVFLFFFFLFFSCIPDMFIFFVSLRPCSSHLLLSASTYSIVRVLSACCVICTLPRLGILLIFIRLVFSRSSYFSGGVFFVVLSYPSSST